MMNKRWIFLLLGVSFAAFFSCNNKPKQADVITEEEAIIVTEPATGTAPDTSNLSFITAWSGKYPKEVNLFGLNVLDDRLKQLMGAQYDTMIANWNTETPIQVEDSIIHTSGCKAHNCPANSYDLYIDLAGNNINIYNFRHDTLTFYAEKDSFALPAKMKADLQVIFSNAKMAAPKKGRR